MVITLAIVNSAAMNGSKYISLIYGIHFLGVYMQKWDAGSYGISITSFLRNIYTISIFKLSCIFVVELLYIRDSRPLSVI